MTATPFDLTDPLPESTLVIEASAGTGKTYTLAALATRFLAERDVRAGELLMVTFTRAATAELRARVRDRVSTAAAHLAAVDAGCASQTEDDPLLVHLASLPEVTRRRARSNLERAVAEFDAATISTIHGFAGQVLGLLGAGDDAATLVDDNGDLTLAVCADVVASEAASGTDPALLPRFSAFVALVQTALGRRGLRLVPDPADAGGAAETAETVRRMVERAVAQVLAQRDRLGQRSFGDILVRLRDELLSGRGSAAAELVRSRYRVALIDEFQDTDPIQWAVFDRLFGAGSTSVGGHVSVPGRNLVLVGDPKQAIYAFRGADVHTYLDAVRDQPDRRLLVTNWRSDGAALSAVEAIFEGITFGSEEIAFTAVKPAPDHRERRLVDSAGGALPGLELRVRTAEGLATTPTRKVGGEPSVKADAAREELFADLVHVVRRTLDEAWLPLADSRRRVRPSDIAVLVRSTTDVEAVRDALDEQGVPAVLARGASVLESPAAEQWRLLLEAVARPADTRRARAFAIGWFGGRDVAWIDEADDSSIAEIQQRLWTWSTVLRDRGVEAFIRCVLGDSGVVERVLRCSDGDRCATDLEHIAELFRLDRPLGQAGTAGLLAVLDRPDDNDLSVNPNAEFEGDAASRRVASEADAVQVMTVWVSKGLEFPIVCCPTMWAGPNNKDPHVFIDDDQQRSFDLLKDEKWPDSNGKKARAARVEAERDGEALRLLYVALTRAKHQTILWWTRVSGCEKGPLGRVLFGGGSLEGKADVPGDSKVFERLEGLVERAGRMGVGAPVLKVCNVSDEPRTTTLWVDPEHADPLEPLVNAAFLRVPDRRTDRWSFSSISARASDTHDNVDEPTEPADVRPDGADAGGGEAPRSLADDGPVSIEVALADPSISPFAPSPAGTAFGLLVHSIYEHVDFADEDLEGKVADRLARELAWRTMSLAPLLPAGATESEGRDRVVAGVVASIDTPLGPDLGDRTLRSFGRADRLDELDFELHLSPGESPLTDRALGRLLLEHLTADDPYRSWAEQVAAGAFDVDLAGYLTGSIDLVLRVREPGAEDRFVVVDYKTNRLHQPDTVPAPGDYAPQRLHAEMAHHHYPLQALLYSVALHRYLRWRQPGYEPSVHLGGVRYLFVRGMAGPATPRTDGNTHGVCRWNVPPPLVEALSDLLAGRGSTLPGVAGAPVHGVQSTAVQNSLFDGEEVSS